jgi:hypothetical protein
MTKPSPPLFASLAKIKNAHRKIAELTALLNAYFEEAKVTLRSEPHDGLTYVIGGVTKLPDEDIPLKVGEAAVQLRDSLDKMTVALAKLNGRGTSGVGFPFGGLDKDTGQPKPFPPTRRTDTEKKLTPAQWALILAQKPHPGGMKPFGP